MFNPNHFLGILVDQGPSRKTLYFNFDVMPVFDDRVILPMNSDAIEFLNNIAEQNLTFKDAILQDHSIGNSHFLNVDLDNGQIWFVKEREREVPDLHGGMPFLFGLKESTLLATGYLAAYDGEIQDVYQALVALTGNKKAGNFARISF